MGVDMEKNVYSQPIEEPEEMPMKEKKLNDLFKLGYYTVLIMVSLKFVGLNMLGNAFYMMFASKYFCIN